MYRLSFTGLDRPLGGVVSRGHSSAIKTGLDGADEPIRSQLVVVLFTLTVMIQL